MEKKSLEMISEKLSPTEIKNQEFKKVMLGYAPNEVVAFLDKTAKTWEAVQKREKEQCELIQSLYRQIDKWKERESELVDLRNEALKEADAIKVEALREAERRFTEMEEKANGIKSRTEEWLTEVINQVQETERQKSHFMKAFRAALDSHYELIKNEQEVAEPLSARLDSFLKSVNQSTATH